MIDTEPAHQNKSAPEVADLADRLNKLSEAASELSLRLTSEELKHRCSVVASGAQVAAALLEQMPHAIAAKPEIHHHAAISPRTISDGIETKLLYQLGWAALELGLKTEALAVLQMVGTLLHGKLGGLVFKVESLLAIGALDEAAGLCRSEVLEAPDAAAMASAIFESLWNQRGATLWHSMKCRAAEPAGGAAI